MTKNKKLLRVWLVIFLACLVSGSVCAGTVLITGDHEFEEAWILVEPRTDETTESWAVFLRVPSGEQYEIRFHPK